MASNSTMLTLIGYTYTNSLSPNTNYANSNPIIISQSYGNYGECRAILQFAVGNDVKSSKINSAYLNFGLKTANDTTQFINSVSVKKSAGVTTGYIYNSVNHSNFTQLIAQGVKESVNCKTRGSSAYNNEVDITSITSNNMSNGILTIILESPYIAMEIDISSISVSVNYESVDPVIPLLVAPNGTYENRRNQIIFKWIYKSQTEATQASATLEYRKGTNGSYTSINIYSNLNYYVMSADTLLDGIYEWRVKTTDTDGKISDYAYGSFTVIDSPAVPIITAIENKCISNITWSSADQVALEIEIYEKNNLVYNKKVSSSSNVYKPNMFFSNTTYTIRLRVCNIYGLWSEWGSKVFNFTFTNPSQPIMLVTQGNNVITIKTDTVGSILYKSIDNGNTYIPIYRFGDSKEFVDYKVANNKIYKYFVRKYEDGYTDSAIQVTQVRVKEIIIQNDNEVIKAELSSDDYMPYSESLYAEKSLNSYVGREYQVCEFGEHKGRTITRSFLLSKNDYDTLLSLYTSFIVLTYRDNFGNMFACILDNIQIENTLMNTMYKVSVSITQIDDTEEISIYE